MWLCVELAVLRTINHSAGQLDQLAASDGWQTSTCAPDMCQCGGYAACVFITSMPVPSAGQPLPLHMCGRHVNVLAVLVRCVSPYPIRSGKHNSQL